jgi:hypothetical protein
MGACASVNQGARRTYPNKTGAVFDGPGCFFSCGTELEDKINIRVNQYIIVENIHNPNGDGETRWIVRGPVNYWYDDYHEQVIKNVTDAEQLGELQYLVVENKRITDKKKRRFIVKGPINYIPKSPYDEIIGRVKPAAVLGPLNYLIVQNNQKDDADRRKIIYGPGNFIPEDPYDEIIDDVKSSINVPPSGYLIIEDKRIADKASRRWIVTGKNYMPQNAYEEVIANSNATPLSSTQYYLLKTPFPKPGDKQIRIFQGPGLYIPKDPYEEIIGGRAHTVTSLTKFQYLITKDIETNEKTVIKGPALVPTDYPYTIYSSVLDIPVIPLYHYVEVLDEKTGRKSIIDGEKTIDPEPYSHYSKIMNQTKLLKTQYVFVEDENGDISIISGETRYTPNPYKKYSVVHEKVKLDKNEYIIVTDKTNGQKKNIRGPTLFTPTPYQYFEHDRHNGVVIHKTIELGATEFMRILDKSTGKARIEKGPQTICPDVHEEIGQKKPMIVLNDTQYLYITHKDTGIIDIISGPQTICPGPEDELSEINNIISLTSQEYVYIKDELTGVVRVEKGPAKVTLKQYEKKMTDITVAHEINENRAVLIKNITTGAYDLVIMNEDDGPKIFIPTKEQEVIQVQDKVVLENHQVMVIVDKDGGYHYMRGDTEETAAFFVPPYSKVLKQTWSKDIQKNHEHVEEITTFDMRSQYMDFEFTIRTSDSVEILVDLNFCWKIIDIEKMITRTNDAPQDVCQHAMSQILKDTSKKDMEDFMLNFSEIIQTAVNMEDPFFEERGITVLRIEITNRKCKDPSIESEFQSLIKEKAEKLRGHKRQEADNDCMLTKLDGEIAAEKKQGELFRVKKSYQHDSAESDGVAEGKKVAGFLMALPEDTTPEKMAFWENITAKERERFNEEQKTKRIEAMASKVNEIIFSNFEEMVWGNRKETKYSIKNDGSQVETHLHIGDKPKETHQAK